MDLGAIQETLPAPLLLGGRRILGAREIFPGFGTPLFYHQSETLGFLPQFIGYLGFVAAVSGLLGSVCYMRLCRLIPLSRLLWLGVSLYAVSSLAYFGYRSTGAAVAIEALYGLCTAQVLMPIFDLLARATPKNFAALGYALIFSLGSLSVSGSDVLGSWIYEQLGRSFAGMILLNSGTSALVLLAIPFLPHLLVAHRDGDASSGGRSPSPNRPGRVRGWREVRRSISPWRSRESSPGR